jgi:hypothetical protein
MSTALKIQAYFGRIICTSITVLTSAFISVFGFVGHLPGRLGILQFIMPDINEARELCRWQCLSLFLHKATLSSLALVPVIADKRNHLAAQHVVFGMPGQGSDSVAPTSLSLKIC